MNLKSLDVEALLNLRSEIDAHLAERRRVLQRQLARLTAMKGGRNGASAFGERRAHPMKGKKRPAKYRDPESGKTWAGVGAVPRWLTAYEAEGRSREEFSLGVDAPAAAKSTARKSAKGRTGGRGRRGRRPAA